MLTVADIMTPNPYTLGPDDCLEDARKLMADHHIRHIPIASPGGSIIGLVSHRDILAAQGSAARDGRGGAGEIALSSIMSSPVHTIDEHASLRGTALHLQQHRLGCLPVLRDNSLVGIITDSDFVSIAINLMEQLENTEPDEYDYEDAEIGDDELL